MKLSPGQILALGGVAIAGFLVFRAVRAGATVLQAINPVSDQNIFNRGFNELTGATDRGSSLGSDIFDFVNRLRGIPEFDPNAPITDQDKVARDIQNGKPRPVNKGPRVFVPPTADKPTLTPLPAIQGSLL